MRDHKPTEETLLELNESIQELIAIITKTTYPVVIKDTEK